VAITKDDCDEKHEKLDRDIEKALEATAKAVAAHLKVWILGSVLGILLAAAMAVVYGVIEIGQYKERVDNTTKQIGESKQSTDRQFEELKLEFREIRAILLRQGGREP
jgi:hypothetical protein